MGGEYFNAVRMRRYDPYTENLAVGSPICPMQTYIQAMDPTALSAEDTAALIAYARLALFLLKARAEPVARTA